MSPGFDPPYSRESDEMKITKNTKAVFVSHEKDMPVLKFIWCWKLATTACVFRRFWPKFRWTYSNPHYRLWALRRRGLITAIFNDRHGGKVWCLTQAGFNAIRTNLPLLVEEGFAPEYVGHDLLVQAVHIGEWLPLLTTSDVGFVTEQQLRCIHPSSTGPMAIGFSRSESAFLRADP